MDELISEIQTGRIAPVYYLCGEQFPVERVAEVLKRAVLGGKEASAFNFDAVDPSTGAAGILAAARTVPMLGRSRLVQMRDAHQLGAEELNKLLPYVEDPAPFSCVLLLAEKADLRLKFFTKLKKLGVVKRFDPLKERQVPGWLAAEARRQKLRLEPGAAERVADAIGTDMGQLSSALERLTLYVGPRKPITPAAVDDLLVQTRQHSIFELTNAVGRGERREALLVLRRMLQDREPGVRIVVMLARHLRQLWSARELSARGANQQAIASQIGIHPFFVKDVVSQANRFNDEKLHRTHRALFEADRKLKSSRLSDAAVLEQLVLDLCPPVGPAAPARGLK
jgi:DNA polymerase-3 subunit delta